jgi:hypothetical protein
MKLVVIEPFEMDGRLFARGDTVTGDDVATVQKNFEWRSRCQAIAEDPPEAAAPAAASSISDAADGARSPSSSSKE